MIRSVLGLVVFLFTAGASFAAYDTALVVADVDLEGAGTSASATFFTAALDGSQEVTATTTDGTGTGAFRLDEEGLHYIVTVSGLTGAITNAHFHLGATGSSGGVEYGINSTFSGNTATGVWPVTSENIGDLLAGNIYVNIHTAANPLTCPHLCVHIQS
jgi:hypothetical protein